MKPEAVVPSKRPKPDVLQTGIQRMVDEGLAKEGGAPDSVNLAVGMLESETVKPESIEPA